MKKAALVTIVILVVVALGIASRRQQQFSVGPDPRPSDSVEQRSDPVPDRPETLATTTPKTSYTLRAGEYDFSLSHGSLNRSYSVHVPPSYTATRPAPVVLTLHGGGGQGNGLRSMTLMDATSDTYGFIVVYPNGSGRIVAGKVIGSWNAGDCCPEASKNGVDDVGFISKLIDDLSLKFNVDSDRIYATGMSNGSQMSFRLACELSEKIAAIAPTGAQGVFDDCTPERPVPVLYMHGTEDPCSPWAGGTAGGCFSEFLSSLFGLPLPDYEWQTMSVPDYIAFWRKLNKSEDPPVVTYSLGTAVCEGTAVGTEREVTLCTLSGSGHTWPGGTYGDTCKAGLNTRACRIGREIVGTINADISANEAMWKFFAAHPMP